MGTTEISQMDPWLDSLSEDWISQPGSPLPSLPRKAPSEYNVTSTNSSGARSGPSGSVPDTTATTASRRSAPAQGTTVQRGGRKSNGVLSERDLNHVGRTLLPGPSKGTSEGRGRRASSTRHSIGARSTQRHQTVWKKSVSASPQKDRRALLTPDWRKRLLGAHPAEKHARDLFSPMGLENIFHPPPPRNETVPRPHGRSNLAANTQSPLGDKLAPKPSSPEQEEQPNWQAEGEPYKGTATQEGNGNGAALLKPSLSTNDSLQFDRPPTCHSQRCSNVGMQDDSSGPKDAESQDKQQVGRSSDIYHRPDDATGEQSCSEIRNEISGSVSGKEDERNEEITPIYISRRHTIDGGVDYAASALSQRCLPKIKEDAELRNPKNDDTGSDDMSKMEDSKLGGTAVESAEKGGAMLSEQSLDGHQSMEGELHDVSVHIADNRPSDQDTSEYRNAPSPPLRAEPTQIDQHALRRRAASDSSSALRKVSDTTNEHDDSSVVVAKPITPIETSSPRRVQEDDDPQGLAKSKMSGCALKLFDNHDTFTNDRLLRRMETLNEAVEEVEAEIQADEGRVPQFLSPRRKLRQREREVTITFSSPLVSHSFEFSAYSPVGKDPRLSRELSRLSAESPVRGRILELDARSSPQGDTARRTSHGFSTKPSPLGASRHVSLGCTSMISQQAPQVDDRDADSSIITRRPSFGLRISTPHPCPEPPKRFPDARRPQPRGSSLIAFHLSPLPDFTIHHVEETICLEASYLTRKEAGARRGEPKRKLSQATTELLERLTDQEPFDPFWEHIRHLNLSDKGLTSLHGLDGFCPRVEELVATNNKISQLTGAPSCVRQLRVSHNCLTSLTAWGHLQNLQYLDISHNDIDSLKGIRGLCHLRELKADHNNLASLEGVLELNGLIKLDISHNVLETLDFAGANMSQLSELNARNNQLVKVRHLGCLPMLTRVDLDENKIASLDAEAAAPLFNLRFLGLSENNLQSLDIGMIPNLQSLHVDKNTIRKIYGLSSAEHLECLSIREQGHWSAQIPEEAPALDECYEIRKLHLSGNLLPSLNIGTEFLNLNHLELATAGLQSLPADFGRKLANVRTLNLNFNALKDISPLVGIVRLKKLLLSGNRLQRLRKSMRTLSRLPTLEEIDIRHNPLTLGFYPPAMRSRFVFVADGAEIQRPNETTDEQFAFSPADPEADAVHRGRLDVDTLLRRRVYELLLASRCKDLRSLDGLSFERDRIIHRDEIWHRLIDMGILYEVQDATEVTRTPEGDADAGEAVPEEAAPLEPNEAEP